jgi:hypothetical protein
LSPLTVSTKLAPIAQESGRKGLRSDGQQKSCRLVVSSTARLMVPLGPLLTNRMSELLTYGSVGGGGSDPAPYPAADAGSHSGCFSVALGPARLHFSLGARAMTRKRTTLIVVAGLAIGIVAALIFAGPALQRSFFYPKAKNLPPVVSQDVEQLLGRLQAAIETNAPAVAQALQPGLSEPQISTLEAQGGFRLSSDLRVFYKWHNGMGTNAVFGLLPGQRFLPLEQCVAERALVRQQRGAAFAIFAGHRKSWVHVLDDGAGDGYFYDPERTDATGAFFYYMAESGYYVWFPSFRNFVSGVIECYETRSVRLSADGKSLDEDGPGTEKIWQRLAKASARE